MKIALDHDVDRIDTTVIQTTISQLRALPRPAEFPYNLRSAPYELQTFRVTGVLFAVRFEDDSDLHLILLDTDSIWHSMIAEIPDSACAIGSTYASAFARTGRTLMTARLPAVVEITGIGFFDDLHGQHGAAPNGIELHPVTDLRIITQGDSPVRQLGVASQTLDSAMENVTVWVNSPTRVFHCAGTQWYGRTKRGVFVTQRQALDNGARPAHGSYCLP